MSNASIVTIGNELLNGHTTDTNAAYICQQLLSVGIPVVSVYTVGDDISQIVRALKRAAEDADIIITTGGLGPTDDDLTRRAFAEFLGVELKTDSQLLETIRQFFAKRGLPMPERNAIQAHIPDGAEPIENPLGTAPGIYAKVQNKVLFALPGVPFEMNQMFEASVLPHIQKQGGDKYVIIRKVRCFGAGESVIAEKLGNLMARERNPLINSTVNSGIITLHVVSAGPNKEQAGDLAQKDVEYLHSLLGDLVFGVDDQTLPEVVGQLLTAQKKTVATAESCTGGLVAKLLTDIPGSSAYFTHGWITYSNKAKVEQLGVPQQFIDQYGAVSKQVCSAMAKSAQQKAQTDFAIAITGIAGPAGGSDQKPVGLVFISVCDSKNCRTERFIFPQDRVMIRLRSALTALNMLRLALKSDAG
ncbi:MAG: competence/damage-inducible protein A [Sedimentisphaerales bacterium]|nr:competence/damage-inducible protein A [Sedimentisphaerales bacterium]